MAIVNWIFLFGDYGPKVREMPSLKAYVDSHIGNVSKLFPSDNDKVEMTLAVIVAAAAQNTPMGTFKAHFDRLLQLNLVMRRVNIYAADKLLQPEHKAYYYYMQYEAPSSETSNR